MHLTTLGCLPRSGLVQVAVTSTWPNKASVVRSGALPVLDLWVDDPGDGPNGVAKMRSRMHIRMLSQNPHGTGDDSDGDRRIPEAVLGLLRDRKDLGIHSEMMPNSLVDLIKSAIEVDLTGQVDFLRGAARAKGGMRIITLPSTAKDRRGVADCAYAAGGSGDVARGCALRDHGARGGVPAREDDPAAGGGADRDRGPEVPGELEEYARKSKLLSGNRSVVAF